MQQAQTLNELLAGQAAKGDLYEKMPNTWVRCVACGHRCKIAPDHEGICKVRFNKGGELYVPRGYVAGLQIDPIEKKPFFHALPGAKALSFGMLGCDYHCAYCQNWLTSQALRDPLAGTPPDIMSAEQIVAIALDRHIPVLTSTYNEPLITSEWAVEIFKLAKKYNIKCSYVSNGNGTPEVLDYIRPHVDLYKIDLKSFRQKNYRQLGGKLENVLFTIQRLNELGIWLEVVTLVIPGFNDSDDELNDIARFLASVSPEIPWHVTAFHQDYRMTDPDNTPAGTLIRAADIGYNAGLHFVYAGNLPGMLGKYENTRCPSCREVLIERHGFTVVKNGLVDGECPKCRHIIPGVWH
ncbi:MAG: AmmeMemoRadiSam system radical SAM enzyme [Bacteroidetes bacterium]|nr:AmmeMemoRadiSam system radical SAM enzyme [Bacteroidota bacterium]MCW5894511.1 AmmeMemoRadiSam system radical SAM enzyme [Bacteroidota bacterium]